MSQPTNLPVDHYSEMTVRALRPLASAAGMKGARAATKPELVEFLESNDETNEILADPETMDAIEEALAELEGDALDEHIVNDLGGAPNPEDGSTPLGMVGGAQFVPAKDLALEVTDEMRRDAYRTLGDAGRRSYDIQASVNGHFAPLPAVNLDAKLGLA